MIAGSADDLTVKRTAVKLLWSACDGLIGGDAPLAAALHAALRSPNDGLFLHNYRIAEQELLRLPRSTSDRLLSLCQARLVDRHPGSPAAPRGAAPAVAPPAPPLGTAAPRSAVEWT